MKQSINLTLGRKKVNNLVFQKLFYISVGFFCVSVAISLGLIAYRLILKSTYDSLDQKEQQLNSQLLANQEKKDKLIEIKSRLVDIRSLLSKRSAINSRLNTLYSVIPSASDVKSVNGSEEELVLSLESDNLSALNDLIEQKITELASDKKKGIQKVEMQSFGLNPKTLLYFVRLEVSFI